MTLLVEFRESPPLVTPPTVGPWMGSRGSRTSGQIGAPGSPLALDEWRLEAGRVDPRHVAAGARASGSVYSRSFRSDPASPHGPKNARRQWPDRRGRRRLGSVAGVSSES